jgi:hypothetical protein
MSRDRFISVRINGKERMKLDQLSEAWGCPRSEVLRFCLLRELSRRLPFKGGEEKVSAK